MVKHGPILIIFIMRKQMRLVMYVLRWQQMGSICMDSYLPHTLVGPCSLSRSISPPPDVIFQQQNIFLSLIILEHPDNNMGVFIEPVWDELIHAWEEGV
jgi:hypothetical protein